MAALAGFMDSDESSVDEFSDGEPDFRAVSDSGQSDLSISDPSSVHIVFIFADKALLLITNSAYNEEFRWSLRPRYICTPL